MSVLESIEYAAISEHYNLKFAKRSGLPYMKHILDGLAILDRLRCLAVTKRAWCIHPILQVDESLRAADLSHVTDDVEVMALAMEYRSVANDYLRSHGPRDPRDIRLSPLSEVNDMLRADKIQNYRDARAHQPAVEASLHEYFQAWLKRLGVPEEDW